MPNTPRQGIVEYYAQQAIINPCRGCEKRTPVCHASCTRYKLWVCRIKVEKKKIENAYKHERRIEEHEIRSKQRTIKRKNRNGR